MFVIIGVQREEMTDRYFYPGTRVKVLDNTLYKDDKSTPLSYTVRPATVVCWYGRKSVLLGKYCRYDNLIDVIFDHRPERVSRAHFAEYAEIDGEKK
jgi:hypothetical protein